MTEGAQFQIDVIDIDLGLVSGADENMQYIGGTYFNTSFTCPYIVADFDVIWSVPALYDCPVDPYYETTFAVGSSYANATWPVDHVQVLITFDMAVLGNPIIENLLPGWTSTISQNGIYWTIDMKGPTQILSINPTDFIHIRFPYIVEGASWAMEILDTYIGTPANSHQ